MENLRYSKTFIDVEEVNESSAVRRAYSAPPVMAPCLQTPKQFVLHQYEQRRTNLQVSNLQLGSQLLAAEDSVISWQVDLSRGSYGHPNICSRPCILFLFNKCHKHDSCGFCHMPHESKPPCLDEQQRDYLKVLPKVTFLKMLVPFVAKRVEVDFFIDISLMMTHVGLLRQRLPASGFAPCLSPHTEQE